MYKKKLLLFLPLFVFIGLIAAHQALALEVSYPQIPLWGIPTITKTSKIAQYISYIFGLGLYLAGFLSLVSFTVGAVQYIGSMDSPDLKGDGKSRMIWAALGLILVLTSFLILQTINLNLITPSITPLPAGDGVYLSNGQDLKPAPASVSDASDYLSTSYDTIVYKCTSGPALLIWEFDKTGLEDGNDLTSDVTVVRKNCGDTEDITNVGSFKWEFETSGVYYCLGGCGDNNMCSGYMSDVNTSSQDTIDSTFAGKIGAVRIVDDVESTSSEDLNTYFGIIFHKQMGLQNGGECNYPIMSDDPNNPITCMKVDNSGATAAADIFTINKNATNAGNGVDFFSEANGWDSNSRAGFYSYANKDLLDYKTPADPSQMCFNYTNVDRPDSYEKKCSHGTNNPCNIADHTPSASPCSDNSSCGKNEACQNGKCVATDCSVDACETFQDCPGSMNINGSYLVGIYSEDFIDTQEVDCQTFHNEVPSLQDEQIISNGSSDISSIYIVPTN